MSKKKKKKKPVHYVDNKEFLAEVKAWKATLGEKTKNVEDRKPVTTEIAKKFMLIAEGLSHKPGFINYPFRDDMVGDAIENCVRYAHNFDSDKYSNPFAYFTQICYYAFIRRIGKEKKQLYVKMKAIEAQDRKGTFAQWAKSQGIEGPTPYAGYMNLTARDIGNFEPKKKRKKKSSTDLEDFAADEENEKE